MFQRKRRIEEMLSALEPLPRQNETKRLLDLLAEDLNIAQGGFGLYERYLGEAVHLSINFRSLVNSRDYTILEAFYNNDNPSKDPRYFSLYDICHLNQLQNNILGQDALVILHNANKSKDTNEAYQMVYDGRLSFLTRAVPYNRLFLYLITPVKKGYRPRDVNRASPALLARLECNLLTPYIHMVEVLATKRFATVGDLLGEVFGSQELRGLSYIQSLLQLTKMSDDATGVLLVMYRGTKIKIRHTQMNSIFESHFENVGVLCAGNKPPTNIGRCLVIASCHNDSLALSANLEVCQFILPDQTERTLINRFQKRQLASEAIPAGLPTSNVNIKESFAEARRLKSFHNEQRKLLEDRAYLMQLRERLYESLLELGCYETDEDECTEIDGLLADDRCCKCTRFEHSNICTTRTKFVEATSQIDEIDFMLNRLKINKAEFLNPAWPCPCAMCQQSFLNQGKDIPDTGPQKRYSAHLDSFEYLRLLGMDTEYNRSIIQECCRLSVATFDIEARTIVSGQESGGVPPIAPTPAQTKNLKAVQKPIMIGFSSDVMAHDDNQYVYELFEIMSDEADESGMIRRFFDYIVTRQKQLQQEKEELLRPITSRLRLLRARHMTFCHNRAATYGIDESQFEAMFNQSLPGRFLQKLEKLKKNLAVYGFNSAKYDNQLILAKLAVIYKTQYPKGRSLQVMMGGSTIKKFAFPSLGVTFMDARFLMAPNASLANFIEMTKLKQSKMCFPHALNVSREFLLEPRLPACAAEWYDPLRRTSPSQKDVNEMLQEFDRLGCANIGEFLAAYLKLDVVLLNQALQRLLQTFDEILDISAVDLGKSTISSLASSAIQMDLYRKKAPCFVTPSVKPIYEALSNASTGGMQ